jgi:hypothetical protein
MTIPIHRRRWGVGVMGVVALLAPEPGAAAGPTRLVSHASGDQSLAGLGNSHPDAISADGRYLLFHSFATDLVAGFSDSNRDQDAFLWDRDSGR